MVNAADRARTHQKTPHRFPLSEEPRAASGVELSRRHRLLENPIRALDQQRQRGTKLICAFLAVMRRIRRHRLERPSAIASAYAVGEVAIGEFHAQN